MEKIGGIFKPQGEPVSSSISFWPELLQQLGLQERDLLSMEPEQLLQELKSRNLSRYSALLQARLAVIISVLEIEVEGKTDIQLRGPPRDLLFAELFARAEQLALNRGKTELAAAIRSAVVDLGLDQVENKFRAQFNRLLGEITANKAELRFISDLLGKKGFLGLYRYLQGADLVRLNDASAARFMAWRQLLGFLLEGEIKKTPSPVPKQEKELQVKLPEIYNQMLLAASRQRLPDLLPYLEELVLESGRDLARATRAEMGILHKEQRLSPQMVEFIMGRLNHLVFMEESGKNYATSAPAKEELIAIARVLRDHYPAIYRYHRQLGLPDLPLLQNRESDLMEKIGGIFKPQGEPVSSSTSFWPELLQQLGLQERDLLSMEPEQLLQELKSRNLSRYSALLQARLAVIISVLEIEVEGKTDIQLRGPPRDLLFAELFARAEQLALDRGKTELAAAIRSAVVDLGLDQVENKFRAQFNRLLGEITANKAELRFISDLLGKKGFLGLYRYLQGADLVRLNDASAARFLAWRQLLGSLLEGEIKKTSSSVPKQEKTLQLKLPEIYNQMLLASSRQRLPDLFPYLEELVLESGRDLARAARAEMGILHKEQRLSPQMVEFIVGRLNHLVFMEETGKNYATSAPAQEELIAAAGLLRKYYPAIYRYHRQLGLPDLPQEDRPILPKFGPCFVAGAVLNLPEDEETLVFLRFWRECSLMRTGMGRKLIYFYNRVGPFLAGLFSRFPCFRPPLRRLILFFSELIYSQMEKKKI